jgi:hypothetical protein
MKSQKKMRQEGEKIKTASSTGYKFSTERKWKECHTDKSNRCSQQLLFLCQAYSIFKELKRHLYNNISKYEK